MGRPCKSKWTKNTKRYPADRIAAAMASICRIPDSWYSESWKAKGGLYEQLGRKFLSHVTPSDRLQLYTMFIRNCDNLKVLFLREVNEITGILPSPIAHSTPKPARNQSDRCGFCLGFADANWVQCTRCPTWYHALCLRIDFKKVETDAHWLCPKCTDLPHESFPSRFVPSITIRRLDPNEISRLSAGNCADVDKASINVPMDVDSVNREKTQLNISDDTIPSPISELELNEVHVIQASDSSDDDFQNIDRIHYKKSQPTVNKVAARIVNVINELPAESRQSSTPVVADPASWLHATYHDSATSVVIVTSDRTVEVPKAFEFSLPKEFYRSYVCERISKSGKQNQGMRKGWLDVIRKEFKQHNKGCCVFNFIRQEVLVGRFGKVYHAVGYCSYGRDCWKTISVDGFSTEQSGEIVFHVSCEGTIMHPPFCTKRNRIQAEEREALKVVLKHRRGDGLATEMAETSSVFSRLCGNMKSTPNAKILLQIRHEMLRSKDLDASPVVDLMIRLERDARLSSYVQSYSLIPLSVVLFTDDQLRILKALHDTRHPIVLHIDATGGIVRNLAETLGDSQVLLYAIVVDNPKSRSCPIAVCEFLSNSQNTDAISLGISRFRQRVTQYLNLPPAKWLKRVETDFSLATISAVVQNLWPRQTIHMYLNMCWQEIVQLQQPSAYNLHVC